MKKIAKSDIEDLLSLTPMQEGMLFHHLKNPGTPLGFEQLCLEISGEIDVELFKEAWNFVVRRNEMLRTLFRWEKVENPLQIILKKSHPQLDYFVFTAEENSQKKKWLEEIKVRDKKKTFDLRDIPFRVTLCRTGKDEYTMIISNHHILYDGWSCGIILKEFFESYEALYKEKQGIAPLVPPPKKAKFKRFLEGIQRREVNDDKEFWQKYLDGFHRPKRSPGKRTTRREIKSTGNYQIKLPQEMNNRLKDLVKHQNITLASLFYALWGLLLQEYNSTNDVLFDTTVSGRDLKIQGIEDIVGLFINTLPLRVRTYPNEKISGYLSRTYRMLLRWSEFQASSPGNISRYLDEGSKESLFDSVLVMENYPLARVLMQKNSRLSVESFHFSGMTHYDLTVIITVFDDITLNFIYNQELFDEAIMAILGEDLLYVVKKVIEDPRKEISALALLSGAVRDHVSNRYKPGEWARRRGKQTGEFSTADKDEAPKDAVEKKLVDLWSELFPGDKSPVGLDTNFFDLGGHSLKASLLRNRIKKEFQVKMPLAEVFKSPTIRELAQYIRTAGEERFEPIRAVEEKEYDELSSAQQRMYNLQQMDVTSTAYNVSSFIELPAAAVKEVAAVIENVFIQLISRHEALRTSFQWINGKPRQKIHPRVEFGMEYQPNSLNPVTGSDLQQVMEDFIRPFDLSQAPLLRAGLSKLDKGGHLLMLDLHHIITDAVSMNLFIKEFNALYKGEPLPPGQFPYKTFSRWQHRRLSTGQLKQQQRYWLKELAGELPVLNLVNDFRRPPLQSFEGDRVHFILDRELTRQLNQAVQETGTTLFMVLLAVLNVLLYKYTAQEDIIIGSTVAGRSYADLDHIMGLFIETAALRNYPAGNKTFAAFLQEVKERALIAFENTDYPFGELMREVGDLEDLSRNPLFSAMLIVQNVDRAELEIEESTCIPIPFAPKVSKVDFTLEAAPTNEEINCHIEYCTKLFKRGTIKRMARHLLNILREVTRHPGSVLSELEIMGEEEKQQILRKFRENRLHLEKQEEVAHSITHRLFEQQVKKTPDNIAIVYEDKQFTYKQLAKKAGDLALVIENLS